MRLLSRLAGVGLLCALAASAVAQTGPRPEDLASPSAVVAANYASLQRPPGGAFDWDRKTALFLPQAVQILATGDNHILLSPEVYRRWADSYTPLEDSDDPGFKEWETHAVVRQYGDVAQVFSTYEKRFYTSDKILGRGINSVQLVRHDGRWWIVAMVWDEEDGAGPVPDEYLQGSQ